MNTESSTEAQPLTGSVAFLNRTYDDAMALLVEARNYVAYRQAVEEKGLPPRVRVRISYETMRMTTRLTQVMAWLLAQRAVQEGEIDQSKAVGADYALGGHEICLADGANDDESLPEGLRALLRRSLSLYERIDRLEQQIRENMANDNTPPQ